MFRKVLNSAISENPISTRMSRLTTLRTIHFLELLHPAPNKGMTGSKMAAESLFHVLTTYLEEVDFLLFV